MRLLYNSPAKNWIESLPLGNGNIGLMLDGGVAAEKIYLMMILCGQVIRKAIIIRKVPRIYQKYGS